MTTGLSGILSREAENGLPNLAGTRLSASLALGEASLVDALRQFTTVPAGFGLHLRERNRVALTFAQFRAGATIGEAVDVQRPRLVLTLDSTVVAWTLRLFLRRPGVQVAGRSVSFDLAQLRAFQTYRRTWAHVRAVKVSTSTGLVRLHLDIAVEAAGG